MQRFALVAVALAVLLTPETSSGSSHDQLLAESPRESLRRSLSVQQLEHASIAQQDEGTVSLDEDAPREAPRRWWPILLSAAMPGLGEAVTGHWRGYALIAVDATLIVAAVDKQKEGEDGETNYKAFADEHYSEEIWEAHLRGDLNSGQISDFFDVGTTPESVPLWVSKEEDEREWYENIGKWEPFFFGWREYWPVSQGGASYWPEDEPNEVFSTALQRQYVDMRVASNDAYARRDDFVNISLLLRVFSIVQMTYLEGFIGGRYDAPADLAPGEIGSRVLTDMTWFAGSDRRAGSRLGLRMRF